MSISELLLAEFEEEAAATRALLGVYFRLLDVPLPMTYGPTADEDMGMGG